MCHPTHPAARRHARAVALVATQAIRLPLLGSLLLLGLACSLMALLG